MSKDHQYELFDLPPVNDTAEKLKRRDDEVKKHKLERKRSLRIVKDAIYFPPKYREQLKVLKTAARSMLAKR
ncbi:hypothetical protein [Sphingobium sp. KCTC 72723]|uniref:hypothetical protein n=1 Tax=Sphingobium sp. KCTC 72723 TaxID=2733867 RepID=UPI00165D74A2|nr:hypothetical protein [Sphingobium sp. KCTC 72723]